MDIDPLDQERFLTLNVPGSNKFRDILQILHRYVQRNSTVSSTILTSSLGTDTHTVSCCCLVDTNSNLPNKREHVTTHVTVLLRVNRATIARTWAAFDSTLETWSVDFGFHHSNFISHSWSWWINDTHNSRYSHSHRALNQSWLLNPARNDLVNGTSFWSKALFECEWFSWWSHRHDHPRDPTAHYIHTVAHWSAVSGVRPCRACVEIWGNK